MPMSEEAAELHGSSVKKAPILAQGGVERMWLHAALKQKDVEII
jgi:hypothetical protein